jgi:mono/diheme cytochrome c family protein
MMLSRAGPPTWKILPTAMVAVLAAWLASCAGGPESFAKVAAAQGERLYQQSCSGCHGGNARGNGPVAPLLGAPMPDLTLLASRRGGVFPEVEVYQIIDGQADLAAHGPRHMPVWGYDFFGEDPDDEAAHRQATEKIERLVRFLKSMQRTL